MACFQISPEELEPIIIQAVDAAVCRLAEKQRNDQTGKILLDKREAADALGVSQATVDRLRKSAGLPAVVLDGRVLFRPEALAAWAQAREETS